jgi:hypothetical protein
VLSSFGKALERLFRKQRTPEKDESETVKVVNQHPTVESSKLYLKALPLRDLSDLDEIKREVRSGNIVIIRVNTLARKSIEDVKRAVNELCEFAESIGGDIARLGEERVVLTPSTVRIWRQKPPMPAKQASTAA